MKAQRLLMFASLLICLVAAAPLLDAASQDPAPAQPAQPAAQPPAQPPAAAPAPAQPTSVSVNVTRTEDTWYMNPVLIGLGVLVLIVLVVLASRGGEGSSTTIVKD